MLTGASTADLAVLLVDATRGFLDQTRRHALIASLLRIPHIVVCVNKMDLVGCRREAFDAVQAAYADFASKLEVSDVTFIPISALKGDNVVERSSRMPWYQGATLLYLLENVLIASVHNQIDCRFPIQGVLPGRRPLYTGRIAGGVFRKGDKLKVLPSGRRVTIASIETYGGRLKEAFAPQSVAVALTEDIALRRGQMLVREHNAPRRSRDLEAMLCWLSKKRLSRRGRYILRHTTRETRCSGQVRYKLDVRTLHRRRGVTTLGYNDIGRVRLRAAQPSSSTATANKTTGSLILIDEKTGQTLAAG